MTPNNTVNREFRNSDVPWLGSIPEEWDLKKLKFLVSCLGGGTPATGNPDFWGGDIPWVSPKDMKFPDIKETEDYLTVAGVRGSATSVIQPNAVLVVVRSGILRHSIPVACNSAPVALNQDMKALIPLGEIGARYLYWIIAGCQGQLLPLWRKPGCTVESIEANYMLGTEVPIPPLDEQDAIVHFLDFRTAQIDALISKKKSLLDKLAEKRTALISHAVTKGLDPSAPLKESGVAWLGEVPAHWTISRIKFIARVGNGSTPSRDRSDYWTEGHFPWLNSSVVNQEEVTESDQFVSDVALRECHLPIIQPPAALIGITGQGKTRGMVSKLSFVATINQHLAYVKPSTDQIGVDYLVYLLERAYAFLRNESNGGGSTKGAITCEQIANLQIPLPPLSEQVAIEEHVAGAIERITEMSRKVSVAIDRLREYRSALITDAVTGKIDVRAIGLPPTAERVVS
jgi:type I restriction enzyme, S subunit